MISARAGLTLYIVLKQNQLKLVYSHKRESLILLNKHFLTDSCIKLLKTIEKLTNFGIPFIILVGTSKRTKMGRF